MATIIRNNKLLCDNCGESKIIPFPIPMSDFNELIGMFSDKHKSCPKTWSIPEPDMSKSIQERMEFWKNDGEQGSSSLFMFKYFTGAYGLRDNQYHPHDPDDFRRCYLLLKAIPEWKGRLREIKITSPVWDKLVDNWDDFTILLEEQLAGKTNNLYDLMKRIGC